MSKKKEKKKVEYDAKSWFKGMNYFKFHLYLECNEVALNKSTKSIDVNKCQFRPTYDFNLSSSAYPKLVSKQSQFSPVLPDCFDPCRISPASLETDVWTPPDL